MYDPFFSFVTKTVRRTFWSKASGPVSPSVGKRFVHVCVYAAWSEQFVELPIWTRIKCMTYAWHAHDMRMTCAWHVHDMCMTCAWHVHDMCMTCAWWFNDDSMMIIHGLQIGRIKILDPTYLKHPGLIPLILKLQGVSHGASKSRMSNMSGEFLFASQFRRFCLWQRWIVSLFHDCSDERLGRFLAMLVTGSHGLEGKGTTIQCRYGDQQLLCAKCVQFDPPCHNDDHGNKPVFSTREHQCFHVDAKLFDLAGAKTLRWFLTHIIAAIAFVLSAFHLRRATLALYGHTRQFRTKIGNACVLSHFMCISQVLISVTADIASMSE